ncbi:hypothetical protein N9U47_02625 [Candidatus Pelagibacter sp.]|nr:hypothetical protein [Candidatus Pelagibacter sp.]
MNNNLIFLLPELSETIGLIIFLILLYFFSLSGRLITNTKDLPINLTLGWSIFILFFHFFIILLDAKISIFYIISIFVLTLIFFISKNKNIKTDNFKSYYFLAPLFFILVSTKSFGWDTFAFYLPRADYLIKFDTLPTEIFRSNYPFTTSALYHFINFFFDKNIENIPAIFDFVLLFLSSIIFLNLFSLNNINIKNIIPLIFLITFFNPIIMNVYSYSAYEDFQVSFVILSIVYFLYLKDFSIKKFSFLDSFTLGLMLSLLSLSKITGVVHLFSISLVLLIINFKKDNINVSNLKKILIIFLIPIFQLTMWSYHVYANEIFIAKDFVGFREEIFKNIFDGYLSQFLKKKLLIGSIFIIPLITVFYLFKKNISKNIKFSLLMISSIILVWNFFLLFWFVYMQTFMNAYEFHDFNRYMSQLSLILVFAFLIIIINFNEGYFKYLNKRFIGHFCAIIFIIFTFVYFEKIRRDLSPSIIALNNVMPEIRKYQNFPILIDHYNSGYLKEILRYRMKNLKFINKKIDEIDYLRISYRNNKFNLKLINN